MEPKQALAKLNAARKRRDNAMEEIKKLKEWLIKKGVDYDGTKARQIRNEKIHQLYESGVSPKEIAAIFNLSMTTVHSIYRRIEYRLGRL